ncbi:unnamed protein product [Cyclocybe aegerita]|uniref:FAD-binding domain-containing protein n=1 Tax=Cyclocybe aegerita TaxID=1973307 RepID=A0A8S0XQX0_CYCAE|nr:unnamed protein product [Cyclocybe aegerita]
MATGSPARPLGQPGVTLKFVVIGGSIAGLATAYGLRNAGHNVTVLEKSDGQAKSKGGLQSPPNMTKILYEWGLQANLERLAHKCKQFIFRNGGSGELIGNMKMDEAFLKDLVADFLFIQHQDLKDVMLTLAIKEGVQILYETTATSIYPTAHSTSIALDNGQVLSADVVVAADGFDSQFRELVTGIPDNDLIDYPAGNRLNITFILPVDKLKEDAELRPLMNLTDWLVWMGSGYVMHANLINEGRDLTATISCIYDREIRPEDSVWKYHPLDYFAVDLDLFESRPRKMLELAKTVSARVFVNRHGLEELVSDDLKLVLVGEAAHPLRPGGNHRTALHFEDAETLRCLFSRIQRRDQISHFLTAYEEIRHPRCQWAHAYDNGFHDMAATYAGPEQNARDSVLRQTMVYGDWDHMDEGTFRAVWGNELSLYVHDARERVDDWWTQWGSLISREQRRERVSSEPTSPDLPFIPNMLQVSVSTQG